MREKTTEEELTETLTTVGTTIIAAQRCTPAHAIEVARELVEAAIRTARAMMVERATVDQMSMLAEHPERDQRSDADAVSASDPRTAGAEMVRSRTARYGS